MRLCSEGFCSVKTRMSVFRLSKSLMNIVSFEDLAVRGVVIFNVS